MTIPEDVNPASRNFDLFSSPFYLMAHADYKYHEDLDKAIAKFGLDRTSYRILTVLTQQNPMNIRDLSNCALIKRSTVSRAVTRMRKEGWVETEANARDARTVDVRLTAEGEELTKRVMQLASRQLERALAGLDETEVRRLIASLQTIVDNLSRLPIE